MDPVTLSVMSAALSGIAEEMGTVLVRSAFSSNIKERRDCSAALFDARGRMVAQAEHIPVHLGAMPESVAAVIAREPAARRRLRPQRPVRGRLAPARHHARLAARVGGEIVGYACTRAHHSDVGGIVPGLDAGRLDLDLAGGPDPPAGAAGRRGAAGDARERAHARDPPGRPRRRRRRRTGSPASGSAELVERRGSTPSSPPSTR